MNRIKSKHKVQILDLSGLSQHALDFLKNKGVDISGLKMKPQGIQMGIVTDYRGLHYLIDEEACGKGDPIETHNAHFLWYKSHYNENGFMDWFDCVPCLQTSLTIDEVKEIPVEKTLSLDKFVRETGGDRINRNFGKWDKFLSGIIDRHGNMLLERA